MSIEATLVVWALLALGIGAWASKLGRTFLGYTFLAIVVSPVIAAIVLLVIGFAGKQCPKCAEKVLPKAKVCKHCGYAFPTRNEIVIG